MAGILPDSSPRRAGHRAMTVDNRHEE